jgi:UDP-N-acetylglucosamine 4,6-dehydratase/5-epimerase
VKKELKGKTILITGGTGFLGRSLIREILKHDPASIRVFSRDEVKHHKLQELNIDPQKKLRHLIGDVRDYERVKKASKGCDIVIHAAALKRIDMIEYNVEEAIKTNIFGTMNIVRAALENNVAKTICVSTDKACSPVNSYGACKFVGERICIETNFSKGLTKPIFSCVRYGNVVDSTGSVIPIFKEKIKNGEELTLTDTGMTRFFITDQQAVDLIFKAIKYADGGEVFIPKIPAFKMTEVIDYLRERYNPSTKVRIMGIRPGEKLHELMINEAEAPRTVEFEDTYIIKSQIQKYRPAVKYYGYLNKSKPVTFKEYSSENSLVHGEKLRKILINMGV